MKRKIRSSLFTLAVMTVMLCFMHITTFAAESVTGVKQVGDTETSANIEWNKIEGARYYGVQWSTNSDFTTFAEKSIFARTDAKIEGLTANTVYYVRVGYGEDSSNCFENFSAPVAVVTTPGKPQQVSFVDADTSTVTISWPAVEGATSYVVTYNEKEYTTADTKMQLTYEYTEFAGRKVEVSTAKVKSVKASVAGYEAKSEDSTVEGLCLLTQKIKKSNFDVLDVHPAINFTVDDVHGEEVAFEFYDLKTKKTKTTKASIFGDGASIAYKSLQEGHTYKYRVRASITLSDGTKKTGIWSDYRYLACAKKMGVSYAVKTPQKKTIKWKKFTGVSKIKIEKSKKRDSGYKAVATVKGTKTSYTLKKLNPNKDKYVRITFYVKVGKKTQKANVIIMNLGTGA